MNTLQKLINLSKRKTEPRGFTLMEIIIVVVTLSVIASLALINYNRIVEQNYCRGAVMNLMTISSAAIMRGTKDPDTDISAANATTINTNLRLNINDSRFTYTFSGTPSTYSALAIRTGGPTYFCLFDNSASPSLTCSDTTFCSAPLFIGS